MRTWFRLGKFVWPYRRKLALSVVFGVLAAALWSFELVLTYPITVMWGEHKTLANYVHHEISETTAEIDERNARLDELDLQLRQFPENGNRRQISERVVIIDAQSRNRVELNFFTSKLWMWTWIESRIVRNLPDDQMRLFATVFSLILLVTLVKGVFIYCQDYLAGRVSEAVVIDLRQEMFRKALKLDPQTISLDGSSAWLNDFTATLQSLTNGLSELGGRIVREPLKAVSCLAVLFFLNWKLTLVFLLFMPALGGLFHWMGQRLKRAANHVVESMGHLYKRLEETFFNVKAVVAFDQAARHRREFYRENKNFYQQAMKLVQIDALGGPVSEILGMLAASAVLLPASFLVLRRTTSIWGIPLASAPPTFPDLMLFYVLLAGVLEPMRKFSKFYTTIRLSTTVAERLFARMDTPSRLPIAKSPQFLPTFSQRIEIRDVDFQYGSASNEQSERGPILCGLDLTIRAGETIAVVGPNGSGKSTFVNLLPRFIDPMRGAVLMDGVNLKDARLRDVREQITLVSQETLLFDDTIMENIRYGRPDATDAEVEAAARRASVTEFSESLPLGLMTPVGESGGQLSGGQRQRIGLARAILRNSPVLLLDEPTSAVDAESEHLIYQSLRDFVQGRTTVLITHCLTPILLEILTRIVVFDRGRVIASGGHAELLVACPVYRGLWEAQTQRSAA